MRDPDGRLEVDLTKPGSTLAEAPAFQSITENCRRQYLDAVEFAWSAQHPTSGARDIDVAALTTCLSDSGIVELSASAQTVMQVVSGRMSESPVRACFQRVSGAPTWP